MLYHHYKLEINSTTRSVDRVISAITIIATTMPVLGSITTPLDDIILDPVSDPHAIINNKGIKL